MALGGAQRPHFVVEEGLRPMALLDIMVEVALVGLCPPQHYDGHGRLAPEPSGGPRFIMGPAFILLHQAPARQARQQEQSVALRDTQSKQRVTRRFGSAEGQQLWPVFSHR